MPPTLNPTRPRLTHQPRRRALAAARAQRRALRARHARAEARRDAEGRRLAARQGRALALPRRRRSATAPPVLIVHSLVSRSYILDLRPGNSIVEFLLDAGLDVFMLDWGVPDELDADNDLERYVDDTCRARSRPCSARAAATR